MGLLSRFSPAGYEGRYRPQSSDMNFGTDMGAYSGAFQQAGMMQPGSVPGVGMAPPQQRNVTMPAPSSFQPTQLFSMALPPGIDPGLAALGQTANGTMPDMTQAPTDAAHAAYGNPSFNAQGAMGLGLSMLQGSQQKQMAPPPRPEFLNPYRFRRG